MHAARELGAAPPLPAVRPPVRGGLSSFLRRIARDRNLYGALGFAETAESLRLCRTALAPDRSDRIAGITSSGDVLLALASRGAQEIAGFDINPAQTAVAELKRAAIEHLGVSEVRRLLGADDAPSAERERLYARIAPELPAGISQRIPSSWIASGALNRGMTYLIIRALTRLLSSTADPESLALFFGDAGTDEARRRALDGLVTSGLVRRVLAPILRTQASRLKWLFFPHTICRVSDRPDQMIADFFDTFAPLFVHGARSNPVLSRAATGALHGEWNEELYAAPRFEAIRGAKGRIRFETRSLTDGLRSLPDRWATKLYLSNAPDYLTEAELEELAIELRRVAAPGARLLYFSLCDLDRIGDRFGPEIDPVELAAIKSLDNVHLYPAIVVRIAAPRELE